MDEVTASQAAALTGLSERTIRRKIAAGEIRARHVAPNRYAIKVADLPVHRSPDELIARIEELEHRVRLLELQLRQPRVGSLTPLRSKIGDAGSGTGNAAARTGAGSLAPSGPALGDLLMQLAREADRFMPLLMSLVGEEAAPVHESGYADSAELSADLVDHAAQRERRA
jgi:excisionase family DNA binding protein